MNSLKEILTIDINKVYHLFTDREISIEECKNIFKNNKESSITFIHGFFNLSPLQISTLIHYSKDLFGVILYLIRSDEIYQWVNYHKNGVDVSKRLYNKSDKVNTGQNLKYGIELMKKYPNWYEEHLYRTDKEKVLALFMMYEGTSFDALRIIGENSNMTNGEFCRAFLLHYENLHDTDKHFKGRVGSFIMIIYNHCTRPVFRSNCNMENFVYLSKRGMFLDDALRFILEHKYENIKEKHNIEMTHKEFYNYWEKRIQEVKNIC